MKQKMSYFFSTKNSLNFSDLRTAFQFSVLCFLFSSNAFSQNTEQLFQAANQSYKQANYPKAIEQYQAIIKQNINNSELYYNLGNAYYKTDQIGFAILNYEKALKLSPEDEDILTNLKIANLKTVDRLNAVPQLAIISWWSTFVSSKSSNLWSVISLVFLWLALVLFALYLFVPSVKKISFLSGALLLLCAFFFFFIASSKKSLEQNNGHGILLTNNSHVKSAPDAQSTDLFLIHEGVKFEVLDQVEDWSKIRLVDGKVGWLPRNLFEVI
jgi:tetratricopeptide (TPR) repeat protein